MKSKDSHGFAFKNPLYSIDATTIDLCLSLCPWADFRKTKAGVKISIKLDHLGKIPVFAIIEVGKKHESKTVENIPLEAGDIVTFDPGYNNYPYFASLCNRKIYFATRLKSNAVYTVIQTNAISAEIVGAIYKDCWQIELFFKAIKQNLKIKRFYGNTK